MKKKSSKKLKEEKGSTRRFATSSGISIKPVYTMTDLPGSLKSRLGAPGVFPYTRGVHPEMYRRRLWTMRQYAGFGSAEETNKRYHYLLSQGITGLSVAFDLPTQMGRDSDHPLSKGEVGRVGVAISSLEDMRILLRGLPLDKVSVSMTINSTAAILLAMLLIVAEEQSVPWNSLQGTIQNDILKEYIARGTYIYPTKPALRLVTDIFSFCHRNVPKWNTISISGYHMREAGANAVQELAFTFSNAITYVEAAMKAGLLIDEFAPRLAFFFNCHNEFFEEIAKFRAARRIWARLVKERFKARNADSMKLRFHTQTAGSSLTAQQPLNNTVRTTVQALAAVLGGTQSLHTNSFDEALGLPTEESARIALRTQQILAYESGVADTVDPLAGSFFIENLTDQLEKETLNLMRAVEKAGGMLKAIEKQLPQKEIERSAYEYQTSIETGARTIVGVNNFQIKGEELPATQKVNQADVSKQLKRLAKYKRQRKSSLTAKAKLELSDGAGSAQNLMPLIVGALRSGLTLGEISDCLRASFGEYAG